MVNVDYFRQYVNFLANKNVEGFTQTTQQFNTTAMAAQLVPMSRDYETFVQTGLVSQYLQTFLTTNHVFNPTTYNQIIPYPADFQYVSSVGNLYGGTQNDATLVDNVKWREMFRPNSLNYPTLRDPKYQQIGAGIVVAPFNWGVGYLDYFHTPVQPVWGYTVVNNRQVYEPTTSVNFEWDMFAINMIASIFLSMIGINLQDGAIAQWSEQFKAETKLPL